MAGIPEPGEAEMEKPQMAEGVDAATGEAAEADVVTALAQERDQYREMLQRTRAEFENYQKRIRREMESERRFAVMPLARDLLPVLDNMQRALQADQTPGGASALLEGISMVARQFEEVLGRHEIQPIPAVGQPLDPHLHEAIAQQPGGEHAPNTVIAEVERGYQMHQRVVRPAKVIVAGAAAEKGGNA